MILQGVRVSVGHSWRFVSNDALTVATDLTGYRGRIDVLKNEPPTGNELGLPWPAYRSRLWTYMFNGSYQSTPSRGLVAALLPLHRAGALPDIPGAAAAEFEVFWHPFAVTTVTHLDLVPIDPWPAQEAASELLHNLLSARLVGDAQVQDSVPLDHALALPEVDFFGDRAGYENAGRFTLASALYDEVEANSLASSLTSLFDDAPRPDAARPVKSGGGAVCVGDGRVGLVLPRNLPRAGRRMSCLHHNVATLLAYVQNLATLTPARVNEPSRWFQGQAAAMLNRLYRRAPADTGTIYRSRVPELWIAYRRLAAAINAAAPAGLPALPEPA